MKLYCIKITAVRDEYFKNEGWKAGDFCKAEYSKYVGSTLEIAGLDEITFWEKEIGAKAYLGKIKSEQFPDIDFKVATFEEIE